MWNGNEKGRDASHGRLVFQFSASILIKPLTTFDLVKLLPFNICSILKKEITKQEMQ